MDVGFLIITALSAVLFSIWLRGKRSDSLPGPMGLPIVGYFPFMTSKPYVKLSQLAKTYGPVYSLQLGSKQVVVLADFKSIKEAYVTDEFMGRPEDTVFEFHEETTRTCAIHGMPWKQQRRFSMHMLRDLGLGKTRMEEHMEEEIIEFVDHMSEYVGKTVIMSDILASSVSNNVASLLFGKRMKYNDPERQRLNFLTREVASLAGALSWQLFFPWIRTIMKYFRIGTHGRRVSAIEEAKAFCRSEIKKHESTLDSNNIRDFIDGYLVEVQKADNIPDSTFKREVLTDLSRLMLGAGSESARIAIDWMLLICASYPDVQKKIHYEIDDVLGRERIPTGQDRPSMPYTEAAICEMMRWRTNLALNVMHYTLKDTKLNGYFIPKHTYVLGVFWALDHDESLWGEDCSVYKPERFLSDDGLKVIKPEYYIPFSVGKRSCLGKLLAELEVFLYVTSILQKFEVRMPPGKQADFEGELGLGLQPKRQELYLKKH